jgi:hypothetical protein
MIVRFRGDEISKINYNIRRYNSGSPWFNGKLKMFLNCSKRE